MQWNCSSGSGIPHVELLYVAFLYFYTVHLHRAAGKNWADHRWIGEEKLFWREAQWRQQQNVVCKFWFKAAEENVRDAAKVEIAKILCELNKSDGQIGESNKRLRLQRWHPRRDRAWCTTVKMWVRKSNCVWQNSLSKWCRNCSNQKQKQEVVVADQIFTGKVTLWENQIGSLTEGLSYGLTPLGVRKMANHH